MTDRVALSVKDYTVGPGVWTDIYTPPGAPVDVPVSVVNLGGDVVELYTSVSNAVVTVPAGKAFRTNSTLPIKARSVSSPAKVQTIFGGEFADATTTETGGLSAAELAVVTSSNTKKELLGRILVELMISNEYQSRAHDEEVTARDLGNGDLRMMLDSTLL